jgi:hypothetical protein
MALTVSKVSGREAPEPFGSGWLTVRSLAFDNSYAALGEPLAIADLGFSKDPDWVEFVPRSGFSFEYDLTNKKVKVLAAIKKYTAAMDPANMTTDAVSSLAVTVTGVAATDILLSIQPAAALEAGLVVQSARVTGADTVTVELSNTSAGTVNGASLNADFYVIKANGAAQEVPDTTDLSALTGVIVKAFGRFAA